jgi:indolepyruvate ferredoxin oxidoreductase beta subunit
MATKDTKSILLAGVGGQGTILMSKVLTQGLVSAGYDVKMSEVHGMAQRGGSVSTQVRYGTKVYSLSSVAARRMCWSRLKKWKPRGTQNF